jgi:cation:H+ antiporter
MPAATLAAGSIGFQSGGCRVFGSSWPLWADVAVFLIAAGSIALAGSKMASLGDRLADRTGIGEAMTGTIFLGMSTSIPGLVASITAAIEGRPALALSNAIGGIAAQTAFLAVADVFHRKANLEHAAASIANILQVIVLLMLLTLVLIGLSSPNVTLFHVNPMTPLLLLATFLGFRLAFRSGREPMWRPEQTEETVTDEPDPDAHAASLTRLLAGFACCAAIVGLSGYAIARAAGHFGDATGIPQVLMGGFFTAAATSLPELITTVMAVRIGALTLAVADIVGGNVFDIVFVVAADLAFLEGSIFHASGIGQREVFLLGMTLLMNVILVLGLVSRERHGLANIGFESVLMLLIYLAGLATLPFIAEGPLGS